jgi:anaerobic ribonucleoside-triphosphate reductase activating protein
LNTQTEKTYTDNQLRIAGIIKESITDGPGIRYVIFAQGCRHNCEGCHNPETHSFDGGTLTDTESLLQDIRKNPPFEQAEVLGRLAEKIKKLGLNVITYTGYTFEQLKNKMNEREGWGKLLQVTDILVDGKFEPVKKSLMLKFRGSTNQRMIDVKRSLESTGIIEADI